MLDELTDYWGFEKLIVFENDGDRIVSPQGIEKVSKIIGKPFATNFPRQLVTSQGKFATRVAAWAKTFANVNLSKSELAEIGQIAENYAMPSDVHYLDFQEGIMKWWKPGTFRAPGSCYYTDYVGSSKNLEELGGVSMRLFMPGGGPRHSFHDHFTGLGRAWLLPYRDYILAFNIYYEDDNTKIVNVLSALASEATGREVKFVKRLNALNIEPNVYVNGPDRRSTGMTYILYSGNKPPTGSIYLAPETKYRARRCDCLKLVTWPEDGPSRRYCDDCGARCTKCGGEQVYFKMVYVTDEGGWRCTKCQNGLNTCHCGRVYARTAQCSCGGER